MYKFESPAPHEDSGVTTSDPDNLVFQDNVPPRLHQQPQSDLLQDLSPDRGIKPIQASADQEKTYEGLHSWWQKTPSPEKAPAPHEQKRDVPNKEYKGLHSWWREDTEKALTPATDAKKRDIANKAESPSSQSNELKSGAQAVKEYIDNLPKLATAASCDIDANFELMMVWKGSSVKAKEVLKENTSPYVILPHTELVFTPSNEKDKSWELRIDSRTGDATALKLNTESGKMEPSDAKQLMEDVTMTLRAAMSIKCFRDGDVDTGRAQLEKLLEDSQKLESEERVKKIIETEANLLYKPVRLRAVTREDFNKILTETVERVRQSKRK